MLPLLKRLNIYFKNIPSEKKEIEEVTPPKNAQSLHWFAGSMPDLDAEAFIDYLEKSRAEWER